MNHLFIFQVTGWQILGAWFLAGMSFHISLYANTPFRKEKENFLVWFVLFALFGLPLAIVCVGAFVAGSICCLLSKLKVFFFARYGIGLPKHVRHVPPAEKPDVVVGDWVRLKFDMEGLFKSKIGHVIEVHAPRGEKPFIVARFLTGIGTTTAKDLTLSGSLYEKI